jgi:hypothetical protein
LAGKGFSVSDDFAVVTTTNAVATSQAFIVYNSSDKTLTYNQNGIQAGLGSGSTFATLDNVSAGLSANDFILI